MVALSPINSFGQCAGFPYSSNGGRFSVSQVKGCAGLTVEICITEPSCDCISCTCDIAFGDGAGDTFTHTYTEPGDYRLQVIFPNPTPSDFIDVTITDKVAPDFDLYACSGNTVQVDVTDSQYDTYQIDFGDGTQQNVPINAANTQHTYTNSTNRTVSVQGIDVNALDNCAVATGSFTPRATLPLALITQLNVLDESSLELRYNLEDDIFYRLEVQPNGTGGFNFIKQLDNNSSVDTIRNLSLSPGFYCFRIASLDLCTNTSTYSNTICSIDLSLTVQDGSNDIQWTTNSPTGDFNIARKIVSNTGSSTTNPFQVVQANDRFYSDQSITCDTEYCYFLTANYGGGISKSNEQCGVATSTLTPNAVDNITISVNDDGTISLEWQEPNGVVGGNYNITKNGSRIASATTLSYTDSIANGNETSSCYTIGITDECDNSNSDGAVACSILLQGTIQPDNTVTLDWDDYEGYFNGVNNYTIQKFYQGAAAGSNTSGVSEFAQTDNNNNQQIISFRVIANPNDGSLSSSVSNLFTVIKSNNIHYPTAFTPDGNSRNETFSVKGQFIVDYSLQIFNRWGEMIFTSNDPDNGWNGEYNSKPQAEGTYIFNLEITDLAGREIKKNGSFLLLRR
ncbi:MAG: gliding motility-associated C-terminal domain-containing protein [Fulvivirga sp.]